MIELVAFTSPLQKILQKPDIVGQLVKWSIELSKYEISYVPKNAMEGQILVYFVAKYSNFREEIPKSLEKTPWRVYVDG